MFFSINKNSLPPPYHQVTWSFEKRTGRRRGGDLTRNACAPETTEERNANYTLEPIHQRAPRLVSVQNQSRPRIVVMIMMIILGDTHTHTFSSSSPQSYLNLRPGVRWWPTLGVGRDEHRERESNAAFLKSHAPPAPCVVINIEIKTRNYYWVISLISSFYFKKKTFFYFSVLFVIWLDFYWPIGVGCTERFQNPTPGGGLCIFQRIKRRAKPFQVAISANRPNIFDSKLFSTNEHYSYNNWTRNQIISTDIDW